MRVCRRCLSISLVLCLSCISLAQTAGRIKSIKLLSAEVGWAATDRKLFWTTDGGTKWKDVTPKLSHKRQMVSSVFFLDPSTGWVLLSCADDRDPLLDDVCFEFASTADGGESWSIMHPKIVDPGIDRSNINDGVGAFSGVTFMQFADPQHGWALLKNSYNTARSVGQMLRTVDGGRTWAQLPRDTPPIAEPFRFINAKDGWIANGPDLELYVTHTAGDSWQRVEVPMPKQVSPELGPVYDLPTFTDEKTGFLPVTYESSMTSAVSVVLFKTDDGGRTWQTGAILPPLIDNHPWTPYPSAVVGKGLLTAALSAGQVSLAYQTMGAGPNVQSANISVHASSVDELSFVTAQHGWVVATYWLLSTDNGGASWTNVTPDSKEVVPPLASSPVRATRSLQPVSRTLPVENPSVVPAASGLSTHLGFDTWPTPPLSAMQAWTTSSPYYDVYIYLYGSPNKSTNKSLYPTSQWVSTVEGTYGWGVAPIWFGLQSSCIIGQPNVTQYFGPTTSDASTQGAQQADLAVAAAQALGITGGIIYTDIESYTVNSTCSPLVQAYVDAWVTEIHVYSGYLAGVYANVGPINSDIHNQNVAQADDIWITKTPGSGKPPLITIWNLGVNDLWWPNGQRTHQFLMNQSTTFGTKNIKIDPDIDNGTVLNANAATRLYSYSAPATIDCPGAIDTVPIGINDMNSSGTFINGPSQTGTVVGTYQSTIGSPYYGFQNVGGVCTQITVSGAVYVEATAVNNQGQIVGYFEDSSDAWHGYRLNPGGSAIQIDFPGATQTYLRGINDAGQIVGWAWNPGTFGYQTFMYYNSQFYDLGVSGGGTFDYMQGFGINGQATLTGIWYFEPSTSDFELAAVPYSSGWSGSYYSLTPGGVANTAAEGIDANDELAGIYYSTSCGDNVSECGFVWTGGPTLIALPYGTDASAVYGINDFAQAVGPYTDSTTGYSNGLIWAHQ